jgi:hypothetical protein
LALQEIEWVAWLDPRADYANKKDEIQREWEHSEGEGRRKIGMIPLADLSVLFVYLAAQASANSSFKSQSPALL